MNLNIVVLGGRLAAPPELRTLSSGSTLLRYLVTARSESPSERVDVIPVNLWQPDPELELEHHPSGRPVYVVGSLRRRFGESIDGRASRLEVVAHGVEFPEGDHH